VTDEGSYGEQGTVCIPITRLLSAGETFE